MVNDQERAITLEKTIKERSEEIIPSLKAKKIKSNNYTRSHREKLKITQFELNLII